jgi:hypothetical protein
MKPDDELPVAKVGRTTQRGWRPPTRRNFVAMLAAAAAALAIRTKPAPKKTIWIGHC